MNRIAIFLFAALVALSLGSCKNGSKQGKASFSFFEKSDKEKADEFVKTLDKDANVLLVLPPSDSVCVYFAQNDLIKCHNVETDSTITIPYSDDIDEEYISDIFAGKNNIMVITKDYDEIDGVFVYDVAKHRFSKLDPCPQNMKTTSTKLSESKQCVTFTCDTIGKAPQVGFDWLFGFTSDLDKELAKTGYYQHVISYNFDGKVIKNKKIPVSIEEWLQKEKKAEQEAKSSDGSGRAVYVWQCSKCGKIVESMEQPAGPGCDPSLPYSNVAGWHMWSKIGQAR